VQATDPEDRNRITNGGRSVWTSQGKLWSTVAEHFAGDLLMRLPFVWLLPALLLAGPAAPMDGAPAATRLRGNPVIHPEMLVGADGENINGPSLIRVPPWIAKPLGRYYLYFADHAGTYIRMAYADRLTGPWRVHRPGVLDLANAPGCRGHIASPDVIVEEQARQFRMYFHCPARAARGQKSFLALSPDGLTFTAGSEVLGQPYFRVFRRKGWWYAMAKGGLLYRSKDGLRAFEQGSNPFGFAASKDGDGPRPRHVAVLSGAGALSVYFSSIGDAPERIQLAHIPTGPDWRTWQVAATREVLRPEFDWEGAKQPIDVSKPGESRGREHALRDPAVFVDADDRRYLVYSVAGENGLAIAELP
jgi:hypothetical protein